MKVKLVGVLILIVFSGILLTGCGGGGVNLYDVTIIGNVEYFYPVDNYYPLTNADIYFNSFPVGTTDAGGNFQFNLISARSSYLEIRKYGYITEKIYVPITSDGEITMSDILVEDEEYSGDISGKVFLLRQDNSSISASSDNPYGVVKVMATKKDYINEEYLIVSDISSVYYNSNNPDDPKNGDYTIEHAKTNEALTVIGIEDLDSDNTIDIGEFFGELDNGATITLNEDDDISGKNIYLQPYVSPF